MAWWLFKTEPDAYSLEDLARESTACWDGIRNYQARNRLRDEVRVGDRVLIHHSSCKVPAVVGIAEVVADGHPDPSQFDPASPLHDPKSSADNPRWFQVTLRYLETLPQPVRLADIRTEKALAGMELVTRPRLSVQKVTDSEAAHIQVMARR